MIQLTTRRSLVKVLTAPRTLVIALTVATGALIVAAIGNRLDFSKGGNSAWLGGI